MDKLFVLRPGFVDHGTTWFCPFCAQVIGFLAYYPQVRDTLEIIEVDFPKPRQRIVELIGEAHQSAPVLVLANSPTEVPNVAVHTANGLAFVSKTIEILRYLATTRGVPLPH
jgi:hypothetical protein